MREILLMTVILGIQSCNSNLSISTKGQTSTENCLVKDCGISRSVIESNDIEISSNPGKNPQSVGLKLHSVLEDGFLNAAELSSPIQLVEGISADGFTRSQFALANAEQACSMEVINYQDALVVDSKSIGTDGSYKVCLRLEESKEKSFYIESGIFIVDRVSPTPIIAGVPSNVSRQGEIFITLEDVYQYRVDLVQGNDCSKSKLGDWITYQSTFEVKDSGIDGTRTLCLDARDQAKNSIGGLLARGWLKDTEAPAAVNLTALPLSPSSDSNIAIGVSGADAFTYRYDLRRGTDCLLANFTDDWFPMSQIIGKSLTTDGDYTICVQGRDQAGNIQKVTTQYTWVKDSARPGQAM